MEIHEGNPKQNHIRCHHGCKALAADDAFERQRGGTKNCEGGECNFAACILLTNRWPVLACRRTYNSFHF